MTLVALIVGSSSRTLAERDARLRLNAAAVQVRNRLDQDMFERFRDIRNAAALSPLFTEGNAPLRRAWFDRILSTYPDYAWLGFASLDGTVVTSANGVLEGQSVAARPWFREGSKAPFVGDVHSALLLEKVLPNPSGEPMRFVDVATPVMDPEGRTIGVLGAHLSWQWARRIRQTVTASLDEGDQGIEIFILDHAGTVLLGPDTFVDHPLKLAGLAAPTVAAQSRLVVWPDQQPYLTTTVATEGYLSFPGLGWSVTIRQPRAIAFAQAQAIQRHVLWIGLGAALLVAAIAWLLAGRLTRPLTTLSEAAHRIRKGEAGVTLPRLRGFFEVASLAHSLNAMTTTLERQRSDLTDLNATLEMRIARRTAALNLMQEVATAANEADDLDTAVRFGLDRLCAHLGWPVGHARRIAAGPAGRAAPATIDLWHLDDPDRFAPFVVATQGFAFAENAGLAGAVIAQRAPVWQADVGRVTGFRRQAVAEACGLVTALAFPVVAGGRTELVVQCFADRPIAEDAESLSIAGFVGLQLSRAAERLAAADRLAEREGRLTAIYDSVLDGIITINPSGSIETMNRAAERVFGHPPGSLLRRNLRLLMAEPFASAYESELMRHLADGGGDFLGTVRELEGLHADGTRFPMEVAFTAATIGERRLLVAAVRDITERRAIERLKNEFVSTVSHELRTPLTSISGALALMAKGTAGTLPDKALGLVAIARSNCDRLVRLINDILDLERIEAGNLVFEFEVVDIADLLDRLVRETAEFAQKYNVELEIAPAVPEVMVWGDRHRLMQVLANLVSNAVKFSPDAGTVTVGATLEDGKIHVTVTDRGRGIPDEFKSRIFQKFAQADASDSRQKGGTGLGLSIVKSIVERHGGTVGFSSQSQVGSTFWFDLPEKHAPLTAPGLPAEESRRKVLICEDDKDVGHILTLHLEQAGYQSLWAHTAAEARELLRQHDFVAMTLDLGLPDQDGLQLLNMIKADPATATMPVVIVSGRADAGGDRLGIADWITKPVMPERLIAALDQIRSSRDRPTVLHVEDDPDIVDLVSAALQSKADLVAAGSLAAARLALEQARFDVIVLDVGLPDGSGLDLLDTIDAMEGGPKPAVVLFSAQEPHPSRRDEMAAVLVKSQASLDHLADMIGQALTQRRASSPRQPTG
ncbi:MAG TPA: ATP-binding protein [Aliidongia sp.]|uniref:ATP-binding protein n=1 Tax=Aliidongia sp. TaxID=1914230 RepID=UPI002DDD6B8D|nr:ATP-binding protein [Aliidongia sp.]HEV2673433.1 ATP-binding protein [Aliidongia sp.]